MSTGSTITSRVVREHLVAAERHREKVLRSKAASLAFLQRIGMLDKNGRPRTASGR